MKMNSISPTSRSIIIFTKNPELGKAKTRIASSVGDQTALDIYIRLLDITKSVMSSVVSATRLLFYSDQIVEQDAWPAADFQKYVQSNGDLGDRMEKAFDTALTISHKALIIGSDCPYITVEIIEAAFDQLDHHDIVIGPTYDGGYYMLGMKNLHARLFRDMRWSTTSVYSTTLDRIQDLDLTYAESQMLNDIDHIEDWEQYLLEK